MATIKISALPAVTTSVGLTDQFEVNNGGTSRRCEPPQIVVAGVNTTAVPTVGWYSPGAGVIRTPNTVTVAGDLTVNGPSGALVNISGARSTLTLADGAAGSFSRIVMRGGEGKYAFAMGVQDLLDNTWSLAASTITGGITFATELFAISQTAGASRLPDGIRIGANSTDNLLDDASNGSGAVALFIGNTQITAVSDIRLKDNVRDTERDAIAIFEKLRVVDHTWNDPADKSDNNRNARGVWTGLIAQEADEHIPWIVNRPRKPEHGDFMWQMDYAYMAPLFVLGFQQMIAQVAELKSRIRELEAKVQKE